MVIESDTQKVWYSLFAESAYYFETSMHGPNNYTDIKALLSSLLVFNRVYRLENSQSCWYFQPLL
jgi:hypothetical protein